MGFRVISGALIFLPTPAPAGCRIENMEDADRHTALDDLLGEPEACEMEGTIRSCKGLSSVSMRISHRALRTRE
jgi:hypothetical protein